MNRAESLARLHDAAANITDGWGALILGWSEPDQALVVSAIRHGEAAVRAIRNCAKTPKSAPWPLNNYAMSQTRLAFRAALNAVGIKGAL